MLRVELNGKSSSRTSVTGTLKLTKPAPIWPP